MLELKQLNKSFRQKSVCQNVSLSVPSGEICAILGASGSGKSTLLNLITGLVAPDSGEIYLNQCLLNPIAPEKREISMMFQDFALLPHLNAGENVAFGLRLRGMNKKSALEQARTMLAEVGLHGAEERAIASLSGGEQQRVALARALIIQPKLILLDEPFSSLDTQLRQQLQKQIRQLIQARNIPAILVSHDPNEACLMADQIAVLVDGKIADSGTPEQLCARPNSAAVAKLLGCVNVSQERYVPTEAISFSNSKKINEKQEDKYNGKILAIFRQPEQYRIHLHHDDLGELTAYISEKTLLEHDFQPNQAIWIQIDESKIMDFQK